MSSIEVVLLAPLVIGFIMVLVCFGILVDARGTVEGAAADAARAGSLRDNPSAADGDAVAAVKADLGSATSDGTCSGGWKLSEINPSSGKPTTNPPFAPGDDYVVLLTCKVALGGLNWFDLGTQSISVQAASPLDTYRTTN
jgi:Flp pilus assembly protein TadG